MQFQTVLKSFRLSTVYRHGPERIDCYALFDGKNGQLINTSIHCRQLLIGHLTFFTLVQKVKIGHKKFMLQ